MATGKSALVLFHGLASSGGTWRDVTPLVSGRHDVYAPTAIGHRGGPPAARHPITTTDLVDWAESFLDENGLDRPHLVGNSLGGFIAIELARRGRAATVCALSPGGFWSAGDKLKSQTFNRIRRGLAMGRLMPGIVPLMFKSATLRRLTMRSGAFRGDRVTESRAVDSFRDAMACTVFEDIAACDEQVAPLDPLPCPITLAWLEKDLILPVESYGPTARERLPHATFTILSGVGHEPMMEAPELIARTILAVTGAAT